MTPTGLWTEAEDQANFCVAGGFSGAVCGECRLVFRPLAVHAWQILTGFDDLGFFSRQFPETLVN